MEDLRNHVMISIQSASTTGRFTGRVLGGAQCESTSTVSLWEVRFHEDLGTLLPRLLHCL